MKKTYFFCGIGGSGMGALAHFLHLEGNIIRGSDRGRDQGLTLDKFKGMEAAGITLFAQDGGGVTPDLDSIVVSSAVEESIPDVAAAKRLRIPIRKRADVLAALFNARDGIAVGGTSGKSTVTGMVAHILQSERRDPAMINGAPLVGSDAPTAPLASILTGAGPDFIAETDESDGSIALFHPAVAVVTNITLDHKPMEELRALFRDFVSRARDGAVINRDDPESRILERAHPNTVTVSVRGHADITGAILPPLLLPGDHNRSNALMAVGAAVVKGIPMARAASSLASFKGIRRRLERVGRARGITVIDDFAHNPDKIAASLSALSPAPRRIVVFQPHGYGPMTMMRAEMAQAFASGLHQNDILIYADILYMGGTVKREITSEDMAADVRALGRNAVHIPARADITPFIAAQAREGDTVVVMGARDDSLSDFAREILGALS